MLFNDIKGPSIPNGIELPPIQQTLLDTLLEVKSTKETCLNYDVSTINLALKCWAFSGVEANQHLSQGEEPTLTSYGGNNDFIVGNPCITQHETTLYSTNDDAMFVFPEITPTVVRKESIPYIVLVPLAKELASILEGNCTMEELEHYKAILANCITETKQKIMTQRGSSAGNMVSSSVRSNKKLKTHGTKHMSFA